MHKKLIAMVSVLVMALTCVVNIGAVGEQEARGTVTPVLTLTATSSTATLYEMPLPPNTRKSLSGTYISKDALGVNNIQDYNGSVATGQLTVTKNAPAHFKSYRSYFSYSLNGTVMPNIVSKYY